MIYALLHFAFVDSSNNKKFFTGTKIGLVSRSHRRNWSERSSDFFNCERYWSKSDLFKMNSLLSSRRYKGIYSEFVSTLHHQLAMGSFQYCFNTAYVSHLLPFLQFRANKIVRTLYYYNLFLKIAYIYMHIFEQGYIIYEYYTIEVTTLFQKSVDTVYACLFHPTV